MHHKGSQLNFFFRLKLKKNSLFINLYQWAIGLIMGVHGVQVIAVTGGKGGVGKTNVAVNLSVTLAQMGRRTLLLDADLGLANVDILLGVSPKETISDVIDGKCTLKEVMCNGPAGMKVIPASSGTQRMVHLPPSAHAGLIHGFSELSNDIDVLVIDTAAGISDTVVSFVRAAQETIIVACNEPTSITDAYALIKLLSTEYGLFQFRLVANMIRSNQDSKDLFTKLSNVTDRFLDIGLQLVGAIPYDEHVRKSVVRRKAITDLYPQSPAAIAFRALAQKVDSWPLASSPRGHLEFFIERLVGCQAAAL